MIIGRTSLGRVAAAINQLPPYGKAARGGIARGGCAGQGRGQVTYWEPLCRSDGLNAVFGGNVLFGWLAECDRGS
jgi:hypothetical protein